MKNLAILLSKIFIIPVFSINALAAEGTQTPEEVINGILRSFSRNLSVRKTLETHEIYSLYVQHQTKGNSVEILERATSNSYNLAIVPAIVSRVENQLLLEYTDTLNNPGKTKLVIQEFDSRSVVHLLMPIKNKYEQKVVCKDLGSELTWLGEVKKSYFGDGFISSFRYNTKKLSYISQMQVSDGKRVSNVIVDGVCSPLREGRSQLDDISSYKSGRRIKYISAYETHRDFLGGFYAYDKPVYNTAEIVGPADSNYSLIIKPAWYSSKTIMIPLSRVEELL